ncbi:hypothetical protein MN116_000278, partial [Schistosoma mekongi]
LPMILLGIRNTIKEDIGYTSSQLVYGTTLTLPGRLVHSPDENASSTMDFTSQLIRAMRQLKPVSPRIHSRPEQVSQHLTSCEFVFARIDATRRPLTPPYEGPFRVLKRADKFFTIDKHGKSETISIDRLKPAFVDSSTDTSIGNTLLPTARSQTQTPDSAQHHQPPTSTASSSVPLTTTRSGRIITKPKRFVHFAD